MSNPLAQINKAEQALATASDIVDILELRTKAKAVEVIAVAQGYADVAQQAKIFQLRAERKAGSWLGNNIQHGGNTRSHRVTLNDLDISKNESSRWQLMASVSDEKFYGWLDERVAKGQEVTAGGLRNYARNIQGKPVMGRTTSGIYLLNPTGCSLIGYRIRCDGPPTGGHIINKSKTRGNKEGRAILAACPPEIMANQCYQHNINRWADEPEAVKIMLLQKIYEFGYLHMHDWFDVFLKTFKVRPIDLELERLIS